MPSEGNNILITAVGAALGGAAVSFAAFKYMEQKKELQASREALLRKGPSFLMEDNSMGSTLPRSDSVIFPHNHEKKMRRRIAARVSIEEDNMTPRKSVTVRVPATSANMGPGCK